VERHALSNVPRYITVYIDLELQKKKIMEPSFVCSRWLLCLLLHGLTKRVLTDCNYLLMDVTSDGLPVNGK
jgi:hypothetical protein